jgi:predicted Rossmann fold nucleotide-binding protein DprA/Smf involved in DNA uptake
VTDAALAQHNLVVSSPEQSFSLPEAGIAAVTLHDVMAMPDRVAMAHFAAGRAVLIPTDGERGLAETVVNRLRRLGIAAHVIAMEGASR